MDNDHSVLYIAEIPDERLQSDDEFSIAGRNKKRAFAELFDRCGYDTRILSPVFVPSNGRQLVPGSRSTFEGIPVYYPPLLVVQPILNMLVTIVATTLALRHLRGDDIDVVVFYNFEPQCSVPALAAKVLFGASLVVEYEDGIFKHPSTVVSVPSRLMRRLVPLDGAFLVSRTLEPHVRTDNTAIVRGLASVYAHPEEASLSDMPDIPELAATGGEDPVDIVLSGGLRRGKGVELFLDAISLFDYDGRPCRFIISGHGKPERKAEIERRVDSITDHTVLFLGRVDPWERYLQLIYAADVLVALEDPRSEYNNYCFPSRLVEYAKTGNVILSSNVADVGTIAAEPFLVLDSYTPEALATLLESVVSDLPANKERAAERTERWLRDECSAEVLSERVERVVSTAASRR